MVDGEWDLEKLLESSVEGDRLFSFSLLKLSEAATSCACLRAVRLCLRAAVREVETDDMALGDFCEL